MSVPRIEAYADHETQTVRLTVTEKREDQAYTMTASIALDREASIHLMKYLATLI